MEIEAEVHQRLMQMEAQVLQDAAQASASREWGHTSGQAGPLCPTCALPLEARGKRQRTLQSNGGESVQLTRTYGTCPKCGAGLFPWMKSSAYCPGHSPRVNKNTWFTWLVACRSSKRPGCSALFWGTGQRTRQTARQRVNCSRHSSSDVNADVCLCGTPLVRFKGHRPKRYCSDRCRQRAHRERHLQAESLPHWSKATLSNASSICSSLAEAPGK